MYPHPAQQLKDDISSWARGVAQAVKCLPSKHEALNSNPNVTMYISFLSALSAFCLELQLHVN
jgi:hypothetical protein